VADGVRVPKERLPQSATITMPVYVLEEVLVAHQRLSISSCSCGWGSHNGQMGQSFAAHVAWQAGQAGTIRS